MRKEVVTQVLVCDICEGTAEFNVRIDPIDPGVKKLLPIDICKKCFVRLLTPPTSKPAKKEEETWNPPEVGISPKELLGSVGKEVDRQQEWQDAKTAPTVKVFTPEEAEAYIKEAPLDPDEARGTFNRCDENIRKMDEAARKQKKGGPTIEDLIEKKYQGDNIPEDCDHPKERRIVIDARKGIEKCADCARNLVNGREIA